MGALQERNVLAGGLEALTPRLRCESHLILDLDPAIALVDDSYAEFLGRLEPAVEAVRVMEGVDRGLTVRPEAGELLADEDFLRSSSMRSSQPAAWAK
jgi:hypothetical protein